MSLTNKIPAEMKETITLLLPDSEVGFMTASCVIQGVLIGFSPVESASMTDGMHRKLFPRAVSEQITAGLDVGYALASELTESETTK